MAKDELYQKIIDDYKVTGSVKRTAENLGTTLVRAQRVLITEGLWSSQASEAVWELRKEGLDVKAIADKLCVTEKTVQAYLPYTKGYYSKMVKSDDARRSEEYRGRKQNAMKSRVHYVENGEKMKEVIHYTDLRDGLRPIDLPEKHVCKAPSVFLLHLELVTGHMDEEERDILRKYGKALQGISRDILVRSDMTFHALHYAIQRAFGWENSHLHKFSFTTETFNLLTDGTPAEDSDMVPWFELYDGSLMKWAERCGTYFRFPTEDLDDLYWDDNYNGEVSIKSWLRRKYTRNYYYGGSSEHFVNARREALRFAEENRDRISNGITIGQAGEDMIFEHDPNELLERLKLEEVLFPAGVKSPDKEILEAQDRARQALYEKTCGKYTDEGVPKKLNRQLYYDDLPWCEDDVRVLPVTNELRYFYDYGDGWEVRIRCTDGYYTNDRYDDNDDGFVVAIIDGKQAIEEMRVYNLRDERLTGEESRDIASVRVHDKPVCIGLDGLPVMDDVHGIHGYIEFLKELHEGEPEEREENKTWAKGMGWTGRLGKAGSVL